MSLCLVTVPGLGLLNIAVNEQVVRVATMYKRALPDSRRYDY
jgi:hypothetical protein